MSRMWAIVERELRRFRRSPILIVVSMVFPLVQLVILGYAFGGNVKHLKVAVVDQDHGLPAVKIRELAQAASSGAQTIDLVRLRRRGTGGQRPAQRPRQRRADDSAGILAAGARQEPAARGVDRGQHRQRGRRRAGGDAQLDAARLQRAADRRAGAGEGDARRRRGVSVRAVHPVLLPGIVVMSIFAMVMIGGGIIFIDDKARGLHEGYLVTPITQAGADCRLQRVGHDQGGACRHAPSR